MSLDPKHKSTALTEGPSRAPARAMLKAVGFSDADLHKPLVGLSPRGTALEADGTAAAEKREDLVADLGDDVVLPGLVLPRSRLGETVGEQLLMGETGARRGASALAVRAHCSLRSATVRSSERLSVLTLGRRWSRGCGWSPSAGRVDR